MTQPTEAKRWGVSAAITIFKLCKYERGCVVRETTHLEKPLSTSRHSTAFSIDVRREDLRGCPLAIISYEDDKEGGRLTSLHTFHEIGPKETENENAKR